MHRLIVPLLSLAGAQWVVLAWWRQVESVAADVSLAAVLFELAGYRPFCAWDPVQRLLNALFFLTPGGLCLILAGGLLLREMPRRLAAALRPRGDYSAASGASMAAATWRRRRRRLAA